MIFVRRRSKAAINLKKGLQPASEKSYFEKSGGMEEDNIKHIFWTAAKWVIDLAGFN